MGNPSSSPHEQITLSFSSMKDEEVKKILQNYRIGLTVEEARKIEELLGRAPSLTEAVIWGIQGSEHSSYKSSRRFLKQFPTTGKHVILGPREDSGIVAMTDGPPGKRWGIVISHESHNHPSQVVPFEGAATGVGGTIRDVACMGARVVGCMDMLRLGDLKTPETREIAQEVARGIGGYGNPLGVPNLGGDTVFDQAYNTNCLVNAVGIGIVREDEIIHSYVPEKAAEEHYDIIIVGKATDRSGFGGAAFASVSMEGEKREQNTGAVQEPNPFLERHLLASTYALFDWLVEGDHLKHVSFKDLGAGGVVCATVEQVAERNFGADIHLDNVHVSLNDLPPEVIACAETQERFCWMCHPSLTEHILKHYNETWALPSVAEHARASVIGSVNDSGMYRLTYRGTEVCHAASQAITQGLYYERPTRSPDSPRKEPSVESDREKIHITLKEKRFSTTIKDIFEAMLAHPNHASKAPFIRHFDKTVIGNTLVEAGEADASIIQPLRDLPSYLPGTNHPGWDLSAEDTQRAVAFSAGGSARYGRISAYAQGLNAVVEAACNVAAVGASPRALTDCLNYGNPEIPEHLGALEQGVKGIADAAKALGKDGEALPVISGNVSLYNSLPDGTAIPPSAIVCCVGVIPDPKDIVTMPLKKPDSKLYLLGTQRDECGGSALYEVLEQTMQTDADALLGAHVPTPDLAEVSRMIFFLEQAAEKQLLLSCHDVSAGGLLLAVFEMTLPQRKQGGGIGVDIDVSHLEESLPIHARLFTESPSFVVEVSSMQESMLIDTAKAIGVTLTPIGSTSSQSSLRISLGASVLYKADLTALRKIWESGLSKALS